MTFDQAKTFLLLGGAAVAALAVYKVYTVGEKVVTESLNPASENNLVNKGVNSAVSSVTGYEESLGGFLHDIFNDDPVAIMEQQTAAALKASKK